MIAEREQEESSKINYINELTRTKPVLVSDVKRASSISVLEKYLLKWSPRDVRFESSYLESHSFESIDSEFMKDMAAGMLLKVINRDPGNHGITLGVYFQSNLAEFEKYNAAVISHNERWTAQGHPEDVFDPRTGDITEILEKEVPLAGLTKKTKHSGGSLERSAPDIERSLYATIETRLNISSDAFEISYVVKDSKDLILYYNKLIDKDITYLIRRLIQEVFGNPFIYGSYGSLLDGIAHLMQGKKLFLCRKFNEEPAWMTGYLKLRNPALTVHKLSFVWFGLSGILFGFIIPVIIFWNGILVMSWHALGKYNDTNTGGWEWFFKLVINTVLMTGSFLLAKYFFRLANVSKYKAKIS